MLVVGVRSVICVGVYMIVLRLFGYLSGLRRNMTWGDTNEGNICPLPHRRRVGLEVADGNSELNPILRAARRQVLFAS